jgi:hypothetical protein
MSHWRFKTLPEMTWWWSLKRRLLACTVGEAVHLIKAGQATDENMAHAHYMQHN